MLVCVSVRCSASHAHTNEHSPALSNLLTREWIPLLSHHLSIYNDSTNSIRLGGKPLANQHHLDLLLQGQEVWDVWRQQHPAIQPDFSQARLRGAHLGGIDLSGANFMEADLSGT